MWVCVRMCVCVFVAVQVAILCGHHKVSSEIAAFDQSQLGKILLQWVN